MCATKFFEKETFGATFWPEQAEFRYVTPTGTKTQGLHPPCSRSSLLLQRTRNLRLTETTDQNDAACKKGLNVSNLSSVAVNPPVYHCSIFWCKYFFFL